jgi:uncharacterized protein YbaA (DUF1428 family)
MNYVDGFVLAVPSARQAAYREAAELSAAIYKDCGALRVVECWGDDVPEGKLTSFSLAVKREAHESIVFSWVEWPSREARDLGMEKFMADPRMANLKWKALFDGQRMIFGGFAPLLVA